MGCVLRDVEWWVWHMVVGVEYCDRCGMWWWVWHMGCVLRHVDGRSEM